jgi:ribose 5-phosphate isomerase B
VGISIAANKVRGVRCVCCSEPYSAELSRRHNDANVLALGSRVVGAGLALVIVDAWLAAEFEGGRHAARVALIAEAEAAR